MSEDGDALVFGAQVVIRKYVLFHLYPAKGCSHTLADLTSTEKRSNGMAIPSKSTRPLRSTLPLPYPSHREIWFSTPCYVAGTTTA